MKIDATIEEVAKFHGHLCPGLAIGYRAAGAAVEALNLTRSKDEELVAIVENDACGVDALQFILGTTFGKGNLIYRDYGKHVYTIIHRELGKAVRVVADFPRPVDEDQDRLSALKVKVDKGETTDSERKEWFDYKRKKMEMVLSAPTESFLTVKFVDPEIPPKAMVEDSVKCEECGEKTMKTKLKGDSGKLLCIPCREKASK